MVVPSARISEYDHFQITKRRTVSSDIKTIIFMNIFVKRTLRVLLAIV